MIVATYSRRFGEAEPCGCALLGGEVVSVERIIERVRVFNNLLVEDSFFGIKERGFSAQCLPITLTLLVIDSVDLTKD